MQVIKLCLKAKAQPLRTSFPAKDADLIKYIKLNKNMIYLLTSCNTEDIFCAILSSVLQEVKGRSCFCKIHKAVTCS